MYKQEDNTRTDKNNWTKVHTRGKLCTSVFICACVFLLFVHLFNCLYLYICFPLVCTFVQLFLSVRVYSSLLNKCTNKKTTHAQIKIIEQRYIQEENRCTDTNNWTNVQTRGIHTHVRVFSSCLYLCSIVSICTSVSSYMHFCSIVSICAFVFLLFVPLFHCFYLCVCFPLVCTFVQQ
jgi:hypothetical protein